MSSCVRVPSDETGVYISLHTVPYLVDCDYGNLVRSRLVGWALVELLTTNERCLKALWVHPSLSASSTRLVLQAFLPRILVEAIEFNTPGVSTAEGIPHMFLLLLLCTALFTFAVSVLVPPLFSRQ